MKRKRMSRAGCVKSKFSLKRQVNILFAQVPASVQSSDLEFLLGGKKKGYLYYDPVKEYGAGAYRIRGNFGTLVFYDQGNGWANIMRVERVNPDSYKNIIARFKQVEKEGWEE